MIRNFSGTACLLSTDVFSADYIIVTRTVMVCFVGTKFIVRLHCLIFCALWANNETLGIKILITTLFIHLEAFSLCTK